MIEPLLSDWVPQMACEVIAGEVDCKDWLIHQIRRKGYCAWTMLIDALVECGMKLKTKKVGSTLEEGYAKGIIEMRTLPKKAGCTFEG